MAKRLSDTCTERRFRKLAEAKIATDDGSCLLTFESQDAACRQIIGLGTAVEIVEPQELRHKIKEMVQRLLSHYRKGCTFIAYKFL